MGGLKVISPVQGDPAKQPSETIAPGRTLAAKGPAPPAGEAGVVEAGGAGGGVDVVDGGGGGGGGVDEDGSGVEDGAGMEVLGKTRESAESDGLAEADTGAAAEVDVKTAADGGT